MRTLDEQIACVRREIGVRESVYPGWIERGKSKPEMAEREAATMRAVLRILGMLRALQRGARHEEADLAVDRLLIQRLVCDGAPAPC